MKILKVNVPIIVYKVVIFEIKVPDEIDVKKLKKEIINGGYDTLINRDEKLLSQCGIYVVKNYINNIKSSKIHNKDIIEIRKAKWEKLN